MKLRFLILGAAVLFALGCDVRNRPDSGTGGGSGGLTGGGVGFVGGGTGNVGGGVGNTGGGVGTTGGGTGNTGGGSGGGSGNFGWDGGTSIEAVQHAALCTDNVIVENAVIVGIDYISNVGSQGDVISQFWIVDQNNPSAGLWVDKFYTDGPDNYVPAVGDVLNLDGFLTQEAAFMNRDGRRIKLSSNFSCNRNGAPAQSLGITVLSRDAGVGPVFVSATFGNADGGWGRPNPEFRSSLVHIPGPLTLSDPTPQAMHRISALGAADTRYFGFELENGVIVNNYKTFNGCDWRSIAADGGTVVFENGLTGIWDTYTHAACEDGGTNCPNDNDRRNTGIVPGTTNWFTYVLYPLDCSQIPAVVNGGTPDSGTPDSGTLDSGTPDAGEIDAGEIDAGEIDAGEIDAGEIDAGEIDAGEAFDAGEELDAGEVLDAGEEVDAGEEFDAGP